MSNLSRAAQQLYKFLFMPHLSEHKAVGAFIIGITIAVPPTISGLLLKNSYGLEQVTRIAGVVSILSFAIYLVYRLLLIYRVSSKDVMHRQKIMDRVFATGIIGMAGILVFQSVMNNLNQFQNSSNIGDIVSIYVGMRAFAGFMLLSVFANYSKEYGGTRQTHDTVWIGELIDSTYDDTQISHRGFWLTVTLSLACTATASYLYDVPAQQIVIAYAILEVTLSLKKKYRHV